MRRRLAVLLALTQTALAPATILGDAIPLPLDGRTGDAGRGRAIATDTRKGLCPLCHTGLGGSAPAGDLGPDLSDIGARLSEGQLRLRLVDGRVLNPATLMPSYYRTDGTRVASAWRGRPVLEAGEIEDVIAYLLTLKGGQATP
ncbi:sulfur oxidation c-type cytochrome SoxX [Methylobacterium sp. 17Sr1-1]|uniref:sulfur oxidation c-type cytochrome SoxX n=1 Tax=Methylobacterium sp. 17Sr1-1 TaxID=2202826 RepID=UPI000D6F5466|nr:sulfur oxidation c-type cytochrome SoxX [Methylobacterium sp. 17Sr1-1]AWN50850.1 sulfur oxidation c-type cytochrome SoxX [Methylobacterium sp. 17Sr1-1]